MTFLLTINHKSGINRFLKTLMVFLPNFISHYRLLLWWLTRELSHFN